MLKIFLFLVFSTFAFAVDSGTEWWIYSYEDIGTLKSVFNYLAMVNQDSGYAQTMKFAIFAGMSFTVFLKFFDLTAIPKYFVSSVAIMMLVFGTTATVHIVNVKSYDSVNPQIDNYATVDNVPYIFSILTSCFSNIGYSSAVLIETIFSSITDNEQIMETSFLKTGHMGAFKLLVKLDSVDPFNLDNNGKNLKKVLENYMQVCIYDIALSTDGNIKNELALQSDYMAYLSPTNSINDAIKRIGTISVKKYDGSSTSCSALFNEANGYYTTLKNDVKIYNAAKALALKDTSNFDNAASSVVGMMNQSNLTNTQAKITTYIMNNGLMGAIENSWQNYGVGTSNGVNSSSQAGFGSGLAIGQLQLSGKVKAKAASMMLPAMHSVLQAVMYVLFPIILVVQLFAGGIKIIQNYVMGLLWLEFWIPSYSVLNYFSTKEAQTEAVNMLIKTTNEATSASGLLNLSNANEIYNTIANEAAIAADMYWMIPALAGFILFASFHSISGITGAVAGVVGQYSNSQTLESQRNEFAALDAVNKEMKNQNPMYTGDIGELKQMQGQMQFQSAASVAAGKFLASGGSSVSDISSMAKTDMFGGYETQKASQTRMNSLTNGGSISNASSTITNNADLQASKDTGSGKAVSKNPNLLTDAEKTQEVTTQSSNIQGSKMYDVLNNTPDGEVKTLNTMHENEQKIDILKRKTSADIIGNKSDEVGTADGRLAGNKSLGTVETTKNFNDNEIKKAEIYSQTSKLASDSTSHDVLGTPSNIKNVTSINSGLKTGQDLGAANTYGSVGSAASTGNLLGSGTANSNIGTASSISTQNPNDIQNASYMSQLRKVSEGSQDFASISKIANENGKSMNQVLDDINKYKKTFDNSKDVSTAANTKDPSGAGTQSGKTISAQNNALTTVNASQERLDKIAQNDLIKSMVGSENLSKMADAAYKQGYIKNNSVEAYVDSLSQKVETTSQDGKSVSIISDNQGNMVGKIETKHTDKGIDTKWFDQNGKAIKSELNADKIDSARNNYDHSSTRNTSITKDSSVIIKDNWQIEAKTSSDFNQLYKRTEGKDAMDAFEKTMINNQNADSVRNAFSNPIGTVTDLYASIKGSYKDSNRKDGEDRVNFEPDTVNYLQERQQSFFNFKASEPISNRIQN